MSTSNRLYNIEKPVSYVARPSRHVTNIDRTCSITIHGQFPKHSLVTPVNLLLCGSGGGGGAFCRFVFLIKLF